MALFGTLETLKSQVCGSKFEKAFAYIGKLQDKNSNEYKTLTNTKVGECNKIVLDENCFVLEQAYITKNKEDCLFESHKKYIDIQCMLKGEELMEYANINDLTEVVPYNENSDAMFWKGMGSVLNIPAGTLYIAFPEDGHKPCCHQIRQNHYKKMVIKIS